MATHGIKQHQRAGDIIVIIFQRLCNALADSLQPCKMNNLRDVVFRKDAFHGVRIQHVRLIKLKIAPRQLFHGLDSRHFTVMEIIKHHNLFPCIQKLNAGVRADKAGAARD